MNDTTGLDVDMNAEGVQEEPRPQQCSFPADPEAHAVHSQDYEDFEHQNGVDEQLLSHLSSQHESSQLQEEHDVPAHACSSGDDEFADLYDSAAAEGTAEQLVPQHAQSPSTQPHAHAQEHSNNLQQHAQDAHADQQDMQAQAQHQQQLDDAHDHASSQQQRQQQERQQREQQQHPSQQQQGDRGAQEPQQDKQEQQGRRSARQPIPAPPRAPIPSPDKKQDKLTPAKPDNNRQLQQQQQHGFVTKLATGDMRERADGSRGDPAHRSGGSGRPADVGSSGRDARPGSGRPAGRQPSPGRDRDREREKERQRERDRERQRERERRDSRDVRSSGRPTEREGGRNAGRDAADKGSARDSKPAASGSGSARNSHHREQPREQPRERERGAAAAAAPAGGGKDTRDAKDRGRTGGSSSGREAERDRERERERERERDRQRERDKERERQREKEREKEREADRAARDRERDRGRGRHAAQQPRHEGSKPAAAGKSARGAAAGPSPFQMVDKFLAKQSTIEEALLPTPTNVNTIHVPGDELLNFIRVQQWVENKLKSPLPLLNGAFVLVNSRNIPELCSQDIVEACGYGRGSSSRSTSSAFVQAVGKCIPWRLRQVEAVEVSANADAGEALLLLEGGGCVKASMVGTDALADVKDYQYLCCELSELQSTKALRGLKVYDIAHVAWRMRVGTELEAAIDKYEKDKATMEGDRAHYDDDMIEAALSHSVNEISINIKKLPPLDWVDGQIMQYVELNPFARPEYPTEAREPLNPDQRASLTRFAVEAWSSYIKHKLEGKDPPPIIEYVPWKALPSNDDDTVMGEAGDPAAAAAGQYGGYLQQQYMQQQAGYGGLGGATPALQQQQRAAGSLLDIDDFADDFGFFDDPLAPMDNNPLLPGVPLLSPTPTATGAGGLSGLGNSAGAGLPKGLLGAGMSLDPKPLGAGLLGAAGGSGSGFGGSTLAGAGEGPKGGADYSYWVERGNQAAAATDPRRLRAAAGRGHMAGLPDAGLTGALGPMWGGQKPPPGMAGAGLNSNKQQQQRDGGRDSGPGAGRGGEQHRSNGPSDSRGRDADRRDADCRSAERGYSDPSAFSMDMRPRQGRPYSSRGPARGSGDGRRASGDGRRSRSRSRSPGGRATRDTSPPSQGRGRTRSRSPVGAKQGDRRGAAKSPGRGNPRSSSGARDRRKSPPAKGRSSSRQGRSVSPDRGRDSKGHRHNREHSPSSSKRRRDGDSRDAGRQAAASPDRSKRSRREGERDGRGNSPAREQQHCPSKDHRGGDSSSRRSRGADADRAGADAGGSPARDIEAVARRFDGRLEGADSIFADIQLERDVKTWLQDLAKWAGPAPRPLEQPNALNLRQLIKELPLPENIVRAYQSMTRFVLARPELSWAGKTGYIKLLPQHHAELLEAASRSTAPSPQQGRSAKPAAAAAAGDVSDPEDYLAGQRSSGKKRDRDGAGRKDRDEGKDRDRDRDRDRQVETEREKERDRGRDTDRGPSGGDLRSGRGGGHSSSRKEQQAGWQEDRQPYGSSGRGRDSGTAAAAAAGSGGNTARKASASPQPRQDTAAAGSSLPLPRPPRTHDKRPESAGRAGGGGRGGGPGGRGLGGAPILPPNVADIVIREFRDKLTDAMRSNPAGYVSQTRAYDLLPLPLADRVKPDSKLTLKKLLDDHYPEFEVRRENPGGPLVVMRHPNPTRQIPDRPCRFWDPVTLDGCVKGAGCDFKHKLVPARF